MTVQHKLRVKKKQTKPAANLNVLAMDSCHQLMQKTTAFKWPF